MNCYNLALWPTWHTLDPLKEEGLPILADDIEAEDPYEALYATMVALKLKRVGHAAIQCPGGFIVRGDDVTLSALEAVGVTS